MMSFREFWPHYLRAHRNRATRIGHYCATFLALSAVTAGFALQSVWVVLFGITIGYTIALSAHCLCDGSRSMVTVNPVWGALADLKMCWLALTGGLAIELAEHVGGTHGPATHLPAKGSIR